MCGENSQNGLMVDEGKEKRKQKKRKQEKN